MKRLGKDNKKDYKTMLFMSILFIAVCVLLVYGSFYFEQVSSTQDLDLTRQALKRATIQCYSIEGSYPTDVQYLEDNYGLTLDKDKFYVEYERIGSNIMPNIEVYERY